jgi:hypothetical protein
VKTASEPALNVGGSWRRIVVMKIEKIICIGGIIINQYGEISAKIIGG